MAQSTVTLQKSEYEQLRHSAERYEMIRKLFELEFFAQPPIRNIKQIIGEFRKTKLYNPAFLKSLEHGLKESAYFS